jgi:DNA repair photolyase
MNYKPMQCSFLLNKITTKDKLFNGNYTLDPYQNCRFGCRYCDSTYDETIYIKTNAVQLLKKELETAEKGTIIVGSVVDPYQKAEERYNITRNLLEIIEQYDFPCHILTKSNLILRDIDLLSKMSDCKVTISITTLDQTISDIFEKNVPLPLERLKTIEKLSEIGINAGLAIIPILPFIVEEALENIVKSAKKHKAHYVLHKHLELRGDQKSIFMEILEESYPNLVEKYEELYKDSYMPNDNYISKINSSFDKLCKKYKLKNKI